MHNADLCDTLGNLVHRATNLCQKYCGGTIPDVPASSPIDFAALLDAYETKMQNFELQGGASTAMQGFRDLNVYLTDEAPWLKKGDEFAEFRQSVVKTTLEAIYVLAHLLIPFIPEGSAKIFRKLKTEPVTLDTLNRGGNNLKVGTQVDVGDVLYTKVRVPSRILRDCLIATRQDSFLTWSFVPCCFRFFPKRNFRKRKRRRKRLNRMPKLRSERRRRRLS